MTRPLVNMFVLVPMLAGANSVTRPIYADIVSDSVVLPTGPYAATYAGASGVQMKVSVLSCDVLSTSQTVPAFQVSADVAASREVDASTLDFGNIGSGITGTVDQTATSMSAAPTALRIAFPSGWAKVAPQSHRRER